MYRRDKLKVLVFGGGNLLSIDTQLHIQGMINDIGEAFGKRLGSILVVLPETDGVTESIPVNAKYSEKVEFCFASHARTGCLFKSADLLVVGCSLNHLDSPSSPDMAYFSAMIMAASLKGQRIVYYAGDCGHLSRHERLFFRRALKQIDLVLADGAETVDRYKKLGLRNELYCTTDNTCLTERPSSEAVESIVARLRLQPDKKPIVLISPRELFLSNPWHSLFSSARRSLPVKAARVVTAELERGSKRYSKQLAEYADWTVYIHSANVVFVVMDEMDLSLALTIQESMNHRCQSRIVTGANASLDDIGALYSLASYQVTGSRNAAMLGISAALPMIGISSGRSMIAAFRDTGQVDYLIQYLSYPNSMPNTYKLADILIERTRLLLGNRSKIVEQLNNSRDSLQHRALSNRKFLRIWGEKQVKAPGHALFRFVPVFRHQ